MITFVAIAAALALAAAALIAVPLIRRSPGGQPPAAGAALAASAVLVFGAAVLYAALSNWPWTATEAKQADSQGVIPQLVRRLERNPEDLEGWLMLGRSYVAIEQYSLAIRAYQRADRLAEGRSPEALIGWAEALVLSDEAELNGRAGELIERAIELDPRSGKALFYGANAAMRRGDLPLARQRLSELLALEPPANVKPILEQMIASIDQQLGAANGNAAAGTRAAVRVNVMLSPDLQATATEDAPLFVIVRDPERPGPPLAVKRLQGKLPQTVELTPSDAMMPGSSFAEGQDVLVIARIARSGSATAVSGDPFGEARYRVGRDDRVDVVIDRLTP